MFVALKLDFGGGQPVEAEVHFGLTGNRDNSEQPQVGLLAVKTAAGDILGMLAKPEEDRVRQAVLAHLETLKENMP